MELTKADAKKRDIHLNGGLLWMQQWTFGFHKTRGISWLADDLLASQEALCSMELVSPRGRPFSGSVFTPAEWAPSTHWIRGWVGPRAGLFALEKRKHLWPNVINCSVQKRVPGSVRGAMWLSKPSSTRHKKGFGHLNQLIGIHKP
jgi:hypothetical protein